MKYGIFSDVHANLEAFEAVLGELKKEKVDQYVFLGDLVGYGADPKKCLEILQDLITKGCLCVAGNHDHAACGLLDIQYFNWAAKKAIVWTQSQLSRDEKDFLESLKLVDHEDDFSVVHASLNEPQEWHYVDSQEDALPTFDLLKKRICFVGHTHRSIVFSFKNEVDFSLEKSFILKDPFKYIVNAGSVGQPRDGNSQACFAVYDTQHRRVDIHRVSYDIDTTQEKILAAGLPEILAYRLSMGQ